MDKINKKYIIIITSVLTGIVFGLMVSIFVNNGLTNNQINKKISSSWQTTSPKIKSKETTPSTNIELTMPTNINSFKQGHKIDIADIYYSQDDLKATVTSIDNNDEWKIEYSTPDGNASGTFTTDFIENIAGIYESNSKFNKSDGYSGFNVKIIVSYPIGEGVTKPWPRIILTDGNKDHEMVFTSKEQFDMIKKYDDVKTVVEKAIIGKSFTSIMKSYDGMEPGKAIESGTVPQNLIHDGTQYYYFVDKQSVKTTGLGTYNPTQTKTYVIDDKAIAIGNQRIPYEISGQNVTFLNYYSNDWNGHKVIYSFIEDANAKITIDSKK